MTRYLVTYDVRDDRDKRFRLECLIEGVGGAQILESAWVVEIPSSSRGLFDQLRAVLDTDDELAVLELGASWSAQLRTGTAHRDAASASARFPDSSVARWGWYRGAASA